MFAKKLSVKKLHHLATLPTKAHDLDAGFDLYASEERMLWANNSQTVGTGIAIAIPKGYVGLICPRSGLAAKDGITVLNGPGVIDSGYTGEIKVILLNTGMRSHISVGQRIAQLLIVPVPRFDIKEVSSLPDGKRGVRGFGSSGS